MENTKKRYTAFSVLIIIAAVLNAEPVSVHPVLEVGFAGVFSHTIQFGTAGTRFDYVNEGGQDVFFPFRRLAADIVLFDSHIVTFLYQPLDIRTNVTAARDVIVENVTFGAGTPLDLRYGFDFYRLSYMYDFLPDPDRTLAAGLSLQIRDAVIDFASADGEQFVANRDVGPVPILKVRYREKITDAFWFGLEADGFYADIKIANGSLENEVTGSILDASLQFGFVPMPGIEFFLNLRFLGGGAKGTELNESLDGDLDDGFTDNQLAAFSVSLGGRLR